MQTPFPGIRPEASAGFHGPEKENRKVRFDASRPIRETDARDPPGRPLEDLAEDPGGGLKMFRGRVPT